MGQLGPLTAQALGRSPYDDVVSGEEGDDGQEVAEEQESQEPQQQYDHRGRPINPESKRLNRDIIRAHNEVMLVVGVAEPDHPLPGSPEQISKNKHAYYEETIGSRLAWATRRCVDAVGVFGLTGTRQRILIYKHHAATPLWNDYRSAWAGFDPTSIFAGVPSAFLIHSIRRQFRRILENPKENTFRSRCVTYIWTYTRAHLGLFAAFQRLGLIPATQLLPSWRWFVPFMPESPIPAPPPLQDFSPSSLMRCVGGAFLSTVPLMMFVIVQQLMDDWRPRLKALIAGKLPSPKSSEATIRTYDKPRLLPTQGDTHTPPPPGPLPGDLQDPAVDGELGDVVDHVEVLVEGEDEEEVELALPVPPVFTEAGNDFLDVPVDYESDEDTGVLSATLISFDIEASDQELQGYWSAELRPNDLEQVQASAPATSYLSTELTQLPSRLAARILSDSALRLMLVPFEAMALRSLARSWLIHHHGGLVGHVLDIRPPFGVSLTWIVNLLKQEFLHLSISGEIVGIATALASYFHKSEGQWGDGGGDWPAWFGQYESIQPRS